MTSPDISRIKDSTNDPYIFKKSHKLKKEEQATFNNQTYTVLTYKKSHGLGWRALHGTAAVGTTLITGFTGLGFSKVRSSYKKAWTGKTIKQVKILNPTVDSIQIPTKADFAYRGSNAEYLILNKKGKPCTYKEYQKALPATNKRFPRPQGTSVDSKELPKLYANEAAEIESEIQTAELTPVKIPKTLYDLFYWHFCLEEAASGLTIKDEDIQKIQSRDGKVTSSALKEIYTYRKDGTIGVNAPMIDFDLAREQAPYGRVIHNRYANQEANENYTQATFQLNERILGYLKEQGINPEKMTWEDIHTIVGTLFREIDGHYQNQIDDPKLHAFRKQYNDYKKRTQHLILGAIWHEYQAPPGVYTIYRAAETRKDFLESEGQYSYSFGHSPLGGIRYDGESGSPISFLQKDVYALDIDISEYESGGAAAQILYIPPARGPNRVAESGEAGHVRSKYTAGGVSGFQFGAGAAPNDLEFLVVPSTTAQDGQNHIRTTRAFFKSVHRPIVGPDTPEG